MTAFRRELGQTVFRWAALLAAALGAAWHTGATAEEPATWVGTMRDADQLALILFLAFAVLAAWEGLRSRRHRLTTIERTAVRSLVGIRFVQIAAILTAALIAAIAALGIGLLVAAGPGGITGPLVLSALPLTAPLLGALLGVTVAVLVPHALAVLLAALLAGGLAAWAQWGAATPWLLLNPVYSSVPESATGTVVTLGLAARGLWMLGLLLLLIALIVLRLRPRLGELVGAIALLLFAGTALAGSLLWLASLGEPLSRWGWPF